jgi:hypothetical protein
MGQEGSDREAKTSSLRKLWRDPVIVVAVAMCVLCLAALSIPTLDGPNMRQGANEAVAVGKLRRITTLENKYAADHPENGFACQLGLLKPTASNNDAYGPDSFLSTERHAGYRTALAGCEPEPNGIVSH